MAEADKTESPRASCLSELLDSFCGSDFDKPFSDDDYTYATNGHFIIRVPRIESINISHEMPDCSGIEWNQNGELVDIPTLPPSDIVRCWECEGSGNVSVCHDCDGTGEITHDVGEHIYSWDCKECDGFGCVPGGKLTCDNCGGVGTTESSPRKTVVVGGEEARVNYLRKFANLPNIKIMVPPVNGQYYMKFDGGDGILMMVSV